MSQHHRVTMWTTKNYGLAVSNNKEDDNRTRAVITIMVSGHVVANAQLQREKRCNETAYFPCAVSTL